MKQKVGYGYMNVFLCVCLFFRFISLIYHFSVKGETPCRINWENKPWYCVRNRGNRAIIREKETEQQTKKVEAETTTKKTHIDTQLKENTEWTLNIYLKCVQRIKQNQTRIFSYVYIFVCDAKRENIILPNIWVEEFRSKQKKSRLIRWRNEKRWRICRIRLSLSMSHMGKVNMHLNKKHPLNEYKNQQC